MICGNGGSAADSAHIVGELMKSFKKTRPLAENIASHLKEYGNDGRRLAKTLEGAIRAVSLAENGAFLTAFSYDKDPSAVFAQQVYGLGENAIRFCVFPRRVIPKIACLPRLRQKPSESEWRR